MKILCTSDVDHLAINVSPDTTLREIKFIISGTISIETVHFRLSFKGKVYGDGARIRQLPIREGDEIFIEFNKTETARRQVARHIKKAGFTMKESELTLKEQLFLQEESLKQERKDSESSSEDGEGEEKKGGTGAVSENGDAAIKKTQSKKPGLKMSNIFRKKKSPEQIEKQEQKKLINKRAKEIEKNLIKAYEIIPEFYTNSGLAFVNIQVNGHLIKGAVDTGAGHTVMLLETAKMCGLYELIDSRYSG